MSVPSAAPICGFDIGTENCYIGVAVKGGIEIVLNDYCLRSTPGYVCLLEKQRELGVSAKQKQNTNIQKTFYNLRRLIGRTYDEIMKDENLPFPVEKGSNGELFVRVFLLGEEHLLTATQLLAMVLTKLKQVSNNALECVINCPNYFTDCQKRELINAASMANIKTLKILPDLSAVALYYCFYRINTKEENNQILAFVDIGASSTQCAVVNFDPKKSSIQVLAVEYDNNLGGRNFDEALANYFIDQKKLNLNKRSKIRLLAECEKLKKQMSANSNVLPINVECLYEDTDFSSSMKRETFEELCTEYFDRIETVLQRALQKSNQIVFENSKKEEDKVSNYSIKVVEVIGGSSRIPAIKKRVKNVFGIDPTSTLNADEVVALGCTLQSAFLSPSFKVVRKLKVIDYQPYQINVQYYHESRSDLKKYSISPFFEKGCTIPFTKQVILTCHELPMVFDFDYINDLGEACSFGKFRIYSKENLTFSPSKMKVRLRIDDNGLIQISSAQLEIEDPNAVEDTSKTKEEGEENSKKIKAVDLEHEILWLKGFLTEDKLDKLRNFESDLVLADKNLNERIDSKNALEEFIYKWRDQIEREEFYKFINSDSKRIFINELKENEKWLLDDEDNCELQSKTIYLERLNQLKKYSDKITNGIKEVNDKKELYQILNNMINNLEREPKDLTESFKNNNAHYLYKSTKNFIPDTQTWINENSAKSVKNEFDEDPQFSYTVLQDKLELLKECFSVFEKNYEETKVKLEEEAKKAKVEKMETENKNNEEAKSANDTKEKAEMEVDSN